MDNRNVVYVKCGFAGENFPTSVLPVWLGRPMLRYEESLTEQELKDVFVGEACAELRNQLDISYPVRNGIVQNWDEMGHVWDHAFFNELKVPVVDGYSFPHLTKRMNVAGRHITSYLVDLLRRRIFNEQNI